MATKRTQAPFAEELPRLLKERGLSQRALAKKIGIGQSHLSRIVRGVDYKTPSVDLMRKVAAALDLPAEYFPEFRRALVDARLDDSPALRDEIFDRECTPRGLDGRS